MLIEGASSSTNGNDNATKMNDEEMDDSSGPVVKNNFKKRCNF